ncbi:PREDICTED: methyltransferase-like protein 23 [Amphimedon queenslandica]|uniref:Methyltransferase-like protein 23 n=1 Tax=Amphimedon queenslandica TaxID=400682 RepID=A0AAN0IXN3_AMPQE|nr:PREDICTED: methyltransferase-like protein 23 [Amphimedon queenslandica]|eukprot:XP_019849206.1 PREDICTED: methyltransferase-like protein 23 [Amphimedon queenslandica]
MAAINIKGYLLAQQVCNMIPSYTLHSSLTHCLFYNIMKLLTKQASSGTAIPGLIAAKCGGSVTLSDREDNPRLLDYLRETCELNGLREIKIMGLTWGLISPDLINLSKCDYVLASDCFYDSKDFEDVMATVDYVLEKRSGCVFWTTYQERSSNRTLFPLLERWGLQCKVIPIEEDWSYGIEIVGPAPDYLDIETTVTKHSIRLLEITKQ